MSDQNAAIIESIIKRPGGSQIKMGEQTYKFVPDNEDRHVATVTDPDHIARFLQITEGFRLLSVAAHVVPVSVNLGVTSAAPAPAPDQSAVANLQPASVPAATPVATQQSAQDTQDAVVDKPLTDMTDAELRAVFRAELGRVPSPKSKPETMIAQIEAIRAERGAGAAQ